MRPGHNTLGGYVEEASPVTLVGQVLCVANSSSPLVQQKPPE
jgi:hypothetical protein